MNSRTYHLLGIIGSSVAIVLSVIALIMSLN